MKKLIFSFYITFILFLNTLPQTIPDSSLWPTSPDTGLVIGYGYDPQIVSDGDGGAIVAFKANNPLQVIVMKVDRYGWLQWTVIGTGGVEDSQILNYVAEDGFGGILISFLDVDEININNSYQYATVQRIDHNGNKLWGNGVRVALVDSLYYQFIEQFKSDGNGGCVISFKDNRNQVQPLPILFDLYAQRIDSLGNRCWGDSALRLTDSTSLYADNSILLVNENSETFFHWWNGSNSRMQKFDIAGNPLLADTSLIAGNIPGLKGISDGIGGFILSGILYDYGNNKFRISCNHISSTGQRLWGYDGISLVDSVLYGSGQSDVTGMLFDDVGNIIISYYFDKSGSQPDTYLQKLTPSGNKLFGDEGVKISNYPSGKRGSMYSSQDSIFIFFYDISRQAYYIQKLDYNGNILWNQDTLFSSDGGGPITTDDLGGLIMVYEKIDFSINLIKISRNGIIGEVLTNIKAEPIYYKPEDFVLHQNYPNPFNNITTIKYQIYNKDKVHIKIYDISGQKLISLINDQQLPGTYRINVDMTSFSSGLYFYQLRVGNNTQIKKLLLLK